MHFQFYWLILKTPLILLLFYYYFFVCDTGKIHAILPTEEARHRYEGERHHALDYHHVLIPGLVNMHCHAAMTLLRGFADDVTLEDWLSKYIWPAESKWIDEEYIEDGTKARPTRAQHSHYSLVELRWKRGWIALTSECTVGRGRDAALWCDVL